MLFCQILVASHRSDPKGSQPTYRTWYCCIWMDSSPGISNPSMEHFPRNWLPLGHCLSCCSILVGLLLLLCYFLLFSALLPHSFLCPFSRCVCTEGNCSRRLCRAVSSLAYAQRCLWGSWRFSVRTSCSVPWCFGYVPSERIKQTNR